MLHCRDDTGRVMISVWLLPDMILGIQAKEFIFIFYFFIKADNFVSGSLRDLQALFDTLQMGCCVTFIKEWLLFGHFTIEAWFVECYRNGCPSWRFSSLQRSNTWALSEQPSISWSPPWLRPYTLIALGRVLVVTNSLGPSILQKSFCPLLQICALI